MAKTITTDRVSPLVAPGLKKVMFQAYKETPSLYEKIFNVSKSNRAYEEWTSAVGTGAVVEKPEGKGINYSTIDVLTPKRITHVTYGLGLRATMEAKQDELYGILNRMASALGKAFKTRREVQAFMVFNMAFEATNPFLTTIHGQPLCSTSHPVERPGYDTTTTTPSTVPGRESVTNANMPDTPSDLDYMSLTDMLTLAKRTYDDEGDFMNINPKHLLVTPEQGWIAEELLKSRMRPDTPNDATSSVYTAGLDWMESPWILKEGMWFLLADKSDHDLQFFNRMQLQIESEDDFDTGDTLIKGTERYSVGFARHFGVWGNKGE